MEIKALKYFLTMAREGNITKAANYLNLTQPNLSRQIIKLERDIGKKLFIRSRHNIELTPEGFLLKKRAEEIIDLIDKTRTDFKSNEKTIAGDIYIGGGETYAIELIAEIMKDIQEYYPNIIYHIQSGNSEDITEKLDKGLLDFGILTEPSDLSKYEYIKMPVKDTCGILMRKNSKLSKNQFITRKDLLNLPLICSKQLMLNLFANNNFLEWFKNDFNKLNIVATYNLIYNASVMVKSGLGYVIGFDKLINTSNSALCFVPLKPKLESGLNIVWKKNQVFSPASKIFLDKLYNKFEKK